MYFTPKVSLNGLFNVLDRSDASFQHVEHIFDKGLTIQYVGRYFVECRSHVGTATPHGPVNAGRQNTTDNDLPCGATLNNKC